MSEARLQRNTSGVKKNLDSIGLTVKEKANWNRCARRIERNIKNQCKIIKIKRKKEV